MKEEKKQQILVEWEKWGLKISETIETYILGGGKGGQNKQKTHNAVKLDYPRLNLSVREESSRSREENRFLARRKLLELYLKTQGIQTAQDLKLKKKIKNQKRRKLRSAQKHLKKSC